MLAQTPIVDIVGSELTWIVAGGIVLIGLVVLGFKDVTRFSITRTWAIATVCFRQSIRRRVLWITPLVILGVIIVSQFQKPVDAQDAVRQTTVYCLFATGLLVCMVTIVLACTNLPQEIENRVIYTVATKPTTRLEIVVGKVLGFVHISFWILLIMGLFTWGYLKFCDWRLRSDLASRMQSGAVDDFSRPTMEYYVNHGTLHARQVGLPDGVNTYAHEPESPSDRWIPGEGEGQILNYFRLDRSRIPPPGISAPIAMGPGISSPLPGGVVVAFSIRARPRPGLNVDAIQPATAPTTSPATKPAKPVPKISLDILNMNLEAVVSSFNLGVSGVEVPADGRPFQIYLPPEILDRVAPAPAGVADIFLSVSGDDGNFEYALASPFVVVVPETGYKFQQISEPIFAGRIGVTSQQQLKGTRTGSPRVTIFNFRNEALTPGLKSYPFEVRVGIESTRDDDDTQDEAGIRILLDFINLDTGQRVSGIAVNPESNRPSYFDVPAAAVQGGNFDVVMHVRSNAWASLQGGRTSSLRFMANEQPFILNLGKSLLILWLMSLLITIISVFCSTFLSWPIAVMLTLVIIFGRWGAEQLGDLTQPGIGRQVATDMFRGSDAATFRTVSESVDILVRMLNLVASVLPDISQFSALEDIQSGLAVPTSSIVGSLLVVVIFGIPLLVLAYVFLKYKEVAP